MAARKKTIQVLSEVKPTLALFQSYLKWFHTHEVMTKDKHEEEQ